METLSAQKCRFLAVNVTRLLPKIRGLRISGPFLHGLCITRVDGQTRRFLYKAVMMEDGKAAAECPCWTLQVILGYTQPPLCLEPVSRETLLFLLMLPSGRREKGGGGRRVWGGSSLALERLPGRTWRPARSPAAGTSLRRAAPQQEDPCGTVDVARLGDTAPGAPL